MEVDEIDRYRKGKLTANPAERPEEYVKAYPFYNFSNKG